MRTIRQKNFPWGDAKMNIASHVELEGHLIFILSALIMTSLSLGITTSSRADMLVDKNHASCVSCHRIQESDISRTNPFPEGIDPSSICLDCHHAENHHPVNFR